MAVSGPLRSIRQSELRTAKLRQAQALVLIQHPVDAIQRNGPPIPFLFHLLGPSQLVLRQEFAWRQTACTRQAGATRPGRRGASGQSEFGPAELAELQALVLVQHPVDAIQRNGSPIPFFISPARAKSIGPAPRVCLAANCLYPPGGGDPAGPPWSIRSIRIWPRRTR